MKAKLTTCSKCGRTTVPWKRIEGAIFCASCLRKPVNKVSTKQAKKNRSYSLTRKEYLSENPSCKAILPGCTGTAHDIHHKAGRIAQKMLDTNTWIPVCRNCHDWIHSNDAEARKLGFLLSRN